MPEKVFFSSHFQGIQVFHPLMSSFDSLLESIAAITGREHVSADETVRALASSDISIWPGQVLADLVVRPGSTEETARVMRLLAQSRVNVVPRGAGLSYTGGAVPHSRAIVIDTTRINGIEVHAEDLHVIVGAGTTWEQLATALKPFGLRSVQSSPISGSVTTVGGLASNNAPGGLDGIVGITAVLADGTVVNTGSSAARDGSAFQRYAGPDLTGLFLGDCGAFAIKTAVVLRLSPEPGVAFASFGFSQAGPMLETMAVLQRRGLVTRAFAMDRAKGRDATSVSAGDAVGIVSSVARNAATLGTALKDVAQLARSRNVLGEAPWSLHLVVEGATEALAQAQLDLARAICRESGVEMDNVVPKTLRAKPYSIRGFLGIDGERWVPVHGILPLSRAPACHSALESHLLVQSAALEAHGIKYSWLISSAGAYVSIEPMFYWNDALDPIHFAHLSERNRKRFAGRAENPSARALVGRLRVELRDIMDQHHAIHGQLGRFYKYSDLMTPGSAELVRRVKHALDPAGCMNAGVLGLETETRSGSGAAAAGLTSAADGPPGRANAPPAALTRGYAAGPWGLVHYYDNGVSGRPLLLLHQAPMSARQFDAVYAPLASRSIRAVGIDLPGFGMSDPTPFVPGVEHWAQAVIAVANYLKLERFDVLGHHTGSLVATELGIRHPDRVRSVVINGPFPLTGDERQARLERLQRSEIDFEYRIDGSHLARSFANRQKMFGTDADPRRTTRMVVEQFQGFAPFWYGHNAAYRYDHAAALRQLKVPALILTNTGDMIYEMALRARSLRPDFDYIELPGGGVDITDQQPEAWSDAVAAFLAKNVV